MIKHLRNGALVQRTDGMGFTVYAAYEDYDGHSTYMHEQGIRMGRIGTRRLPAHLDALEARSDERLERVGNWHDSQYREAYVLIGEAFPEAKGTRSMGEVSHSGNA